MRTEGIQRKQSRARSALLDGVLALRAAEAQIHETVEALERELQRYTVPRRKTGPREPIEYKAHLPSR